MPSAHRARGGQAARIASGDKRERALVRFCEAVRELSDDPSAVSVLRYLRCSLELDVLQEADAKRSEQSGVATAHRPSTRRGDRMTVAS
jgi:hypothetical protein